MTYSVEIIRGHFEMLCNNYDIMTQLGNQHYEILCHNCDKVEIIT